jgi:2-polyprenyl-3-methyl-5-hydroxy-6-metoxy-1,4-benzoquinol methylase
MKGHMLRTELLLSMIDLSGIGLEIGPGYNPLLPKSAGYCIETLDHASAKEIREKYRDDHSVDVSRIEEVDFVSDGRSIAEIVGKPGHYDYIVASHVIEHTTDMLGFLKDCQSLLKKRGVLVLAIPDKRRCFDLLQPLTSTGMVLQAHEERRTRHPAGLLFDDFAYNVARDGAIGWSAGANGKLGFCADLAAARSRYNLARASSVYVDAHAWRFTPSSFRLILHDLNMIEEIELRENAFHESSHNEFYVSLSRAGSGCPFNRLALARMIIAEHQEIILGCEALSPASNNVEVSVTKAASELGGLVSNEALTNAGERMIVGNAWGYWAHLSIYHFAVPFARGRRVLDAGSGAGYGSAYLARHGGQVLALEASPMAVGHSRQRYAGDSVTFEVADLNEPLPFGDALFDLVFSSNVFEHVANVDGLAAECARVVKPEGVVIVAVPPICSAEAMTSDMENNFHVHHIPPTAWHAKLERFFDDVQCHCHVHKGEFAAEERYRAEMALPPDRVTIRETDFDFPKMSAQEMLTSGKSITAVFVCQGRRLPYGEETVQERTPSSWREGAVSAKTVGNLISAHNRCADLESRLAIETARSAELQSSLAELEARIAVSASRLAAIEASTSWRMTAPLRSLVGTLRGPR